MPSPKHLGIVDLLNRDLAIIPEMLARAEGREPPTKVRYESRDGRLISRSFRSPPREIQVDLLVLVFPADVPGAAPQTCLPIECQRGRDPEKLYRYVEYLASARRDNRCPGQTVVFSPDDGVLRYVRRLFAREPHLCPVLVGKDAVPMELTLDQAIARPELATFCAIVHASSDVGLDLARKAMVSARHGEPERGRTNVRILLDCLKEDQVNELTKTEEFLETAEELDTWTPGEWYRTRAPFTIGLREGLQQGREEGLEEGREEGRAAGLKLSKQALRLVLTARGLFANDEQLAVIDGCMAIDAVEHWILRAANVGSVAELLAGEA